MAKQDVDELFKDRDFRDIVSGLGIDYPLREKLVVRANSQCVDLASSWLKKFLKKHHHTLYKKEVVLSAKNLDRIEKNLAKFGGRITVSYDTEGDKTLLKNLNITVTQASDPVQILFDILQNKSATEQKNILDQLDWGTCITTIEHFIKISSLLKDEFTNRALSDG